MTVSLGRLQASVRTCVLTLSLVAPALTVAVADEPPPAWKSSPYHGVIDGDGNVIPCRCLFRGKGYMLGDKVCMDTYKGVVMTTCDMLLNNTTWVPTSEPCTLS